MIFLPVATENVSVVTSLSAGNCILQGSELLVTDVDLLVAAPALLSTML